MPTRVTRQFDDFTLQHGRAATTGTTGGGEQPDLQPFPPAGQPARVHTVDQWLADEAQMTAMKDTVAEAGRQLAEQFRAAEEQRTHRLGALALREQIHDNARYYHRLTGGESAVRLYVVVKEGVSDEYQACVVAEGVDGQDTPPETFVSTAQGGDTIVEVLEALLVRTISLIKKEELPTDAGIYGMADVGEWE